MKIVIQSGAAILTCSIEAGILAVGLISAAVSGYSSYQTGQAKQDAANYEAEVADIQAKDVMQKGADAGAQRREDARRIAASQTEALSMSGVSLNSGTPLSLLTETAGLGELDVQRAVNNARREAWGLKAGADLSRAEVASAAKGGSLNAFGTFLGGASTAYYGYKS